MKEVLLSVLMIFWGCCSVWTVGLDLKIMSVTTFMINETSLFFWSEKFWWLSRQVLIWLFLLRLTFAQSVVTSEQTDKADKMGQVWGYVYSNLMEQICVHTLSNDMYMIFMVQSTNISILWTNDIYMIFMEQIFPWNNDMYMVLMEQICSYLEQLYGVVFT